MHIFEMSSSKDIITTNLQLAQQVSLIDDWRPKKCTRQVLQKLDDVNAKVTPTNYLKLHKPHLLGSTVLHLAYNFEHASGLCRVLSQDTNVTIKNQDNLTILHLVLLYHCTNEFRFANLRSTLDNDCVNLILSAHLKTRNFTNPCDGNGISHFHIACMANNVEVVNFFLDNDVFIDHAINSDSPYFAGFTALHLAIRCCNLQVARILLKRGANIHLKNAKGETAPHMVMENYLKFAYDDVLGFFGSSDLPKKCANEEIAKLLLEIISNNNTTIIDDSGLSSLHLACTMTNSSIAEKLETTQNINQSINIKSPLWPGYTPLHFAAHVNINTVKILVKKGADLSAKDAHGMLPIDLYVKGHKTEFEIHDILSTDSVYKEIKLTRRIKLTNLIFAMKDSKGFTKFLDNHSNSTRISIPKNAPLWPGFTLLHLAVLFCTPGDYDDDGFKEIVVNPKHLQFVTELYNRNPNVIVAQDNHGRTPVHLAFRLGKPRIVELLLQLHENLAFPVDLVDDENLSLLHIACSRGKRGSSSDGLVEKLLVRSKKNVGLAYEGKPIRSFETGWTPLHVAVAGGCVNVVELLLKHGADVHVKDVHGVTPIHLLLLRNKHAAKHLLAVTNLKECVVEDVGLSHLHVACHLEDANAVKKLLDGGSDVNLTITRDRKVIDKTFEFSKLVTYLDYTPLQATQDFSSYSRLGYGEKRSGIVDLLVQREADIFVVGPTGMPFMLDYLIYCDDHLKEIPDIQRRAEDKFGLTKVHVACFFRDFDCLKKLLDEGANVNGKLSMDLPEYGGFTPLPIVMEIRCGIYGRNSVLEDEFVKVLLDAGADVTISNAKLQTPLHMFCRNCTFYSKNKNF